MDRRGWKSAASYAGLLAAAWLTAVAGSWRFGAPLDNAAYDYMFRRYEPALWQAQSVLLAIDETTLQATPGGMSGIRKPLAWAVRLLSGASPKVVAVDITL